MLKLCSVMPVFRSVMTSFPHGAEDGVIVNPKSNMFTSTLVVCGLAHVFPVGDVVVVGVVDVTGGGGGGGATATPTTPFIPSLAWPGIVQRYSYLPFFIVSVSVCDLPGASDLVTLPTQLF